MNCIIHHFHNFTVTAYCQHIPNFGKRDRLSQYTEDFSRIYWVLKHPALRCRTDLSAVKRYHDDIFIFGQVFHLVRHLTYGKKFSAMTLQLTENWLISFWLHSWHFCFIKSRQMYLWSALTNGFIAKCFLEQQRPLITDEWRKRMLSLLHDQHK